MELKALIFDVDGTLAETEEAHRQAFNETFKARGLDWHWDRPLYKELLGVTGGKERMRHFISTYAPPGGDDMLGSIKDLHGEKTRRYVDLVASGAISLRPGVSRLFREALDNGVQVAIATTTSLANVTALLESALASDLREGVSAIAAGDMVEAKKPAPDVFLLALDKLGLDARQAIGFEDSELGLQSAKDAGLRTLVTPSTYTDDHNFASADAVVSDLGDRDSPMKHISGRLAGESQVTVAALAEWPA